MHVYIIKNSANGKAYVGKTTYGLNEYFRWNLNAATAGKKTKPYLYSAIRKHGRNAFSIHPLTECCSNDELNFWERKFIALFGTQDPKIGYNLCAGGEGVSGISDAQRKAISDRMQGNAHSANRGPLPIESVESFRKKVSGDRHWTKRRPDYAPWNKGLTKTDDPRIKANAGTFQKGVPLSPEIIAKRAATMTGRKRPDVSERLRVNNPRSKNFVRKTYSEANLG